MVLQLGLLWPCPQILRPDWKGFPRASPLAYWALSSETKEKSFITLTPVVPKAVVRRLGERRVGSSLAFLIVEAVGGQQLLEANRQTDLGSML
jgi:hypothetical protein